LKAASAKSSFFIAYSRLAGLMRRQETQLMICPRFIRRHNKRRKQGVLLEKQGALLEKHNQRASSAAHRHHGQKSEAKHCTSTAFSTMNA
jgi:hypothetical protein